MELVLAGKLKKVIADELQIGMRTVEMHRSILFEKMGVGNAVELAQILAARSGKPALRTNRQRAGRAIFHSGLRATEAAGTMPQESLRANDERIIRVLDH